MNFNFENALNKGKSAADLVINNNNQIAMVLDEFKTALSKFIGCEISLTEETEYEEDPSAFVNFAAMLAPKKPTGRTNLYIRNVNKTVKSYIFSLERNKNGYPITIIFDKDYFVADTQEEVANAINEISENSQFHISLNSFIAKQKNELAKNRDSSLPEA